MVKAIGCIGAAVSPSGLELVELRRHVQFGFQISPKRVTGRRIVGSVHVVHGQGFQERLREKAVAFNVFIGPGANKRVVPNGDRGRKRMFNSIVQTQTVFGQMPRSVCVRLGLAVQGIVHRPGSEQYRRNGVAPFFYFGVHAIEFTTRGSKIRAVLEYGHMTTPRDQALALFAYSNATGEWPETAFAQWQACADIAAWNQLEEAWQREGNPESFSWKILKMAVEAFSQRSGMRPLTVLDNFLYPPGVVVQEGYWLDWQTDADKADVFLTAQKWTEAAVAESTLNGDPDDVDGLKDHAHMLLRLAVSTDNMPLWRNAPEACVAYLDWDSAMPMLNWSSVKPLLLSDIQRIPVGERSLSMVEMLLKASAKEWHNVARCIEFEGGPGLWAQHVFSGGPRDMEFRRKRAWNNMKLDGVDAWALVQYVRPAPSFEESLNEMERAKFVMPHEPWARQWWMQCVLGMDYAQAYSMACCIRAPIFVDDVYQVNASLFEGDDNVLS